MPPTRVALVLPVYSDSGIALFGGGERYVWNVARALNHICDVTLITFGPRPAKTTSDGIRHLVIRARTRNPTNPVPLGFLPFGQFDLIHAFQVRTVVTSILALACRTLRKPLIVTDLGGGGRSPMFRLQLHRWIPRFVTISDFSRRLLPREARARATVVKGGVDVARLAYDPAPRARRVLQVGRIMPHKGMNYLIEAADPETEVVIAGTVVDRAFYGHLNELSKGKNVRFLLDPTDLAIHDEYRRSAVTVSASVYQDMYGNCRPMSELLGLTLLESMAVGTPVVCTAVGGMPEYVTDGVNGLIVQPNSGEHLQKAIRSLLDNVRLGHSLGKAAHNLVQQYSWDNVAANLYREYVRTVGSLVRISVPQ